MDLGTDDQLAGTLRVRQGRRQGVDLGTDDQLAGTLHVRQGRRQGVDLGTDDQLAGTLHVRDGGQRLVSGRRPSLVVRQLFHRRRQSGRQVQLCRLLQVDEQIQ